MMASLAFLDGNETSRLSITGHTSVTNLSPSLIENSSTVQIRPNLHIHENTGKVQPIMTNFGFPWSAVSREY